MKDTVRLGRVAGVSVGLHWSLIAMVVLVATGLADRRFSIDAPGHSGFAYIVAGVLTAAGLFVGVFLHEMGHAIVARRAGLEVEGVTLSWMGGVTRIQGEASRPGSEFVIAGVGPLVSVAVGALLALARLAVEGLGGSSLVIAALGWLAAINIVLAVFNLLPAAPLDGGRVLHSMIWGFTHDRWKATRVASAAGVGLGALMFGFGFLETTRSAAPLNGVFISFIGWWILVSARAELGAGAIHRALDGMRMSDLMRPVGSAPGWITVRTFADTYAAGRPGWVWLLENWGGGYGGILLGDSLAAVPYPQWDLARPLDIAMPISATVGAAPTDDPLDVMSRLGSQQVILVVESGRTVGAVLPSDVAALVKMGGKGPVPSKGWSLTRG